MSANELTLAVALRQTIEATETLLQTVQAISSGAEQLREDLVWLRKRVKTLDNELRK